ncbi:MAG TPA: ATP-binding protein [Galbitalea sp.]|nr:ATP-binding protein [Galbitalea sp.]
MKYKGFKKFRVTFGRHSLLMGPNNAGKSTIINALRLCGAAGRVASRLRPTESYRDLDRTVVGFPIEMIADDGYEFGNIAHEFETTLSRVDLLLENGSAVHLVWPEEAGAFFWVEVEGGLVTTPAQARAALTRIGLVPTLTPIEKNEKILSPEHLAQNVETKLASRHFRNNIRAVKLNEPDEFPSLIDYLLENTPEITTLDIEDVFRDGAMALDLYFRHPDSRVRKELFWAGDGLQIWLQILFHMWRTRDRKTVILDEPDVFLHPDLQRRLVRVVEASGRQTILASHAAEVASEANMSSLIWIDRSKQASRLIGDDEVLAQFSALLGSAFNLSIARALRARTALFVEGQDVKVLRVLARKLDAKNFASETGLSIVGIGGFSHWPSVEAFGWIKSKFLGNQVRVRVLLDRDYRTIEESDALVERLAESDVLGHVWARKELESYLLETPALARVSGLDEAGARATLNTILESLRPKVFGQYSRGELTRRNTGEDDATVIARASVQFEALWSDENLRRGIVPAKKVLSEWNATVSVHGGKVITAAKLAASIRVSEIDEEMRQFIELVESDLT